MTPDCESQTSPARRASVTVTAADPVAVAEGGSAAYTVVLDGEPTGNVVIAMSSDNGDVTAQPASLTFTTGNWQTAQTETVSAGQDGDAADDTASISRTVSGSDEYTGIAVASVNVSVTDDDADAQPAQQEPENNAPVADAGPDQTIDAGDAVSLDGSGSSDPDGDTLTYAWTQTSGPSVTLSDASSANPGFTAPNADATLVFSLTVNDGTADSAADTVAITVVAPDPQREALEAFYNATGGHSWTNVGNWLTDKPLGQWHGVSTNGQGQVTHLSLRNNGLSGSLPAALGNLEALQVLSLDRNSIGGSLPSSLVNLPNLSIIGLARNSLSGSLPSSLGNLTGLTKLSLHDNTGLSGSLPSGFTSLANLQRLAIANTGLCAPSDEAFDDWLDTVPAQPGGVPTCE